MTEVYKDYKYKKIKRFLENEFIPRYIQMKRRKNYETGEIETTPSIQLYNIVCLDYDDETLKYVLKHLKKVGVLVEGQDPIFFLNNFDYVRDFKNNTVIKKHVNNDHELVEKYLETGDIKLRDALIMKNVGIVKYISYRFSRKTNLNMEEIESYGYEGLMQAVNNYKLDANSSFASFAYTCIKNTILKGIPQIYGFKAGIFFDNFNHSKIEIENLNGERLEDNPELIYDIVELMLKNVSKYYKTETKNRVAIAFPDSLDNQNNQNIVSEDEPFEKDMEKDNINEKLLHAIETLPFREQEIIKYLYGFKDGRTHTLEEVGEIFFVSRERIRTIQANALKKLRHPKNSKNIRVSMGSDDDSLTSYNEQSIVPGHKF